MEDIFKGFTEDQLWENFENDFFRCNEPELFEKIKELCGEEGLADYALISDAIEFTDYAMENVMATSEIIFVKKYLDEMMKRKGIHPQQKQLAKKFIRELNYNYFYMF